MLERKQTGLEGLQFGIKKDGKKYAIRDDRSRYFFPSEWMAFYSSLRKNNQMIYESLLQTGARINELIHLKPSDIDFDRFTITLRVTKKKHAFNEKIGKKRTFVVSPQFAKKMKKYIQDNKIEPDKYIFHGKKTEKPITAAGVQTLMRDALIRAKIKDYYNFSLHNIRKTTGNWLKALGVNSDEICLRLGHDHNTYLKHYGSATIFDRTDRIEMIKILGNMYGF